jgi:hypothetical protein
MERFQEMCKDGHLGGGRLRNLQGSVGHRLVKGWVHPH